MRERERHVNIQPIVEEHYERYFDHMREAAQKNFDSVIKILLST